MERCPNEIWLYIFKFACDDEGATGRRLSLVSRQVNQLSREYKLQSVAVEGPAQLAPFLTMLENTPERYRRIRHLFISSVEQVKDSTGKGFQGTKIERHYEGTCAAYLKIMQLTSSTLVTFTLVSHLPRTLTLLPVSCPNLVELNLQGPFPAMLYNHETPSFPSLRHLTFSSFTDHPVYLFEDIAVQAPGLQRLAFYPTHASRSLHLDLFSALDIEPPRSRSSPPPEFFPSSPLPSAITEVLVQPGPRIDPETRNASCLKNVQEIMRKHLLYMQKHDKHKRIKCIQPGRPLLSEEALARW